MTEMMKAIRMHEFGGPEVLRYETVPKPSLEKAEVLVRVRAIGINPPDWYLREGYKMLPPEWQPPIRLPVIPGTDISGVVEAVADGVERFKVGDEVYSMVRFPVGMAGESSAYAEFVSVPEADLAHKPKGIEHIAAAAAPMSILTAWQFMIDAGRGAINPLQAHPHEPVPLEGKSVLINGAAGGVGHLALQLAKWKGARVTAVASGRHQDLLLRLGADQFIDYTRYDPGEVVRGADLIVDAVGGRASQRFLRCIRPGGALFPIFPLGFEGAEEARTLGVNVSTTQVQSNGAQLEEIAPLLQDGTIEVVIDRTYPLAEARQAHERAAIGHIQGKIVLVV